MKTPNQALVVRLEASLARRVVSFVDDADSGYNTINEFAAIAFANQLNLEEQEGHVAGGAQISSPAGTEKGPDNLLAPLNGMPEQLPSEVDPPKEQLFVLTNRLSPIKVAARVLGNMQKNGAPDLDEYQLEAARTARLLGLRLREDDASAGRKGAHRAAIAFPTGKNERAAMDRFIASFTLDNVKGSAIGPMALLGLATIHGDRVMLTTDGWKLAAAPSPLLGEADGERLSEAEASVLVRRIGMAPAEKQSVAEFLDAVAQASGVQSKVDADLRKKNKDWTPDFAASFRSAMVGRLADVGVVRLSGRGPNAKIEVVDREAADELMNTGESK